MPTFLHRTVFYCYDQTLLALHLLVVLAHWCQQCGCTRLLSFYQSSLTGVAMIVHLTPAAVPPAGMGHHGFAVRMNLDSVQLSAGAQGL